MTLGRGTSVLLPSPVLFFCPDQAVNPCESANYSQNCKDSECLCGQGGHRLSVLWAMILSSVDDTNTVGVSVPCTRRFAGRSSNAGMSRGNV